MEDILQKLRDLSEEKYKKFCENLIPTSQEILGIRIPVLRKQAIYIAKENWREYVNLDKQNIHDAIVLEGLVLSYVKQDFVTLLPFINNFLNKVDNWAQIDSSIMSFKNIKEHKQEILKIVESWLNSDKEYVIRAGLVMLLSNFIEEKYLDYIFNISNNVKYKGYYVHMANAWLISVAMAKFPEKTIEFFKNNKLDKKTHNKAIQKSRESFRVSKENKELLKTLKK